MKIKLETTQLYIDTSIHGANSIYVMSEIYKKGINLYALINIETGNVYTAYQKREAKAFGDDRADFQRLSAFKAKLRIEE